MIDRLNPMESHLRSLPSFRKALGAVLVVAVIGCGDDGTGPTVGPPAKLAFTVQPTDATAGASIAPAGAAAIQSVFGNVITAAVAIQDASGNVVTTATNAVTIALGVAGFALSDTATVNAVNGIANFTDLTIEQAASGYTLVATSGNLTSATSAAFSVTAAAASQLALAVQPTDVGAGVAIGPAVEVSILDSFDNLVTTAADAVTVAIGTNPSGGTLSGTTTANAMAGVASFNDLSIDKTGIGYTLVATSGNLTSATSAGFLVCLAPPSGVVSWWPADGDAVDIIGPNDGALLNGATFAPGKVDQAFSFDGVDDFVGADGTGINDLQQLTIDAWVKHNSLPPGEIQRYVTLQVGEKAVLRYDGESGPRQLHFFMNIDGVLRHVQVNNVLEVGVFHHVAGTYDGSVMRLYLDGVEVGSLAVSGTVGAATSVGLSSDEEALDGLLDEISIYNRTLTPSEIQAIVAADSAGKCKG